MNIKKLKEEYRIIMKRWESGDLYYRYRKYVRVLSRSQPITSRTKENVCSVLAVAKCGLPIMTQIVKWVREESNIHSVSTQLAVLASLHILKANPRWKGKLRRRYSLHPDFVEQVYEPTFGKLNQIENP